MLLKVCLMSLKKFFCVHKYAFINTEIIGCKRVSIHKCIYCEKKKYIAFENGLESIERHFHVNFD